MDLSCRLRRFRAFFDGPCPGFVLSGGQIADQPQQAVACFGYVGQTELSAVSLANQFQFLLSGVFFGISSGVTMLASQYWGKKDTNSIQAVMGIATKIAAVITVVLATGAVAAPKMLMRIYTNDGELISIGAGYLQVIGISYVCMSFSQVYLCVLRSMERAHLSTLISTAALLLNIVLNAVFIFGIGGAPKLGVLGVAIGTVTARIVELLLCFADALRGKVFRIDLKVMFGSHRLLFQDFGSAPRLPMSHNRICGRPALPAPVCPRRFQCPKALKRLPPGQNKGWCRGCVPWRPLSLPPPHLHSAAP